MGIRPNITFGNVKPKLDGGYKNIGLASPVKQSSPILPNGIPFAPAPELGTDKWKELSINLSITDMLSQADLKNFTDFLKTVNKISNALMALIRILRLLTSDLKSINRALKFVIGMIVEQLKSLIYSFLSQGIYLTVITPNQSPQESGFAVSTWGNFDEFRVRIASTCMDFNDIGSPARFSPESKVGGFVIGGICGSNYPQTIDDIYTNMKILGSFFNTFKIALPAPPYGLSAVAGAYGDKLGIQLSWRKDRTFLSGGFRVYRCSVKGGVFPSQEEMSAIINNNPTAKDPNQVRNFQKIKIFDNDRDSKKPFNGGKPLFIGCIPGQDEYSVVDYDVQEKTVYYYRVYTVFQNNDKGIQGDPYLFRVDSPLSSNEASSKALGCIPVSEISKGILTTDGGWIDENDYATSKWNQINLSMFFGSQIDKFLKQIETFADSLAGIVSTGSDAIIEYIEFFSHKISDYIQIIQTITDIINLLMNFRLKGSLLFLDLTTPKIGGIQGFVDRMMTATVQSNIFGKVPRNPDEVLSSETLSNVFGKQINKAISDDMGYTLSQLRGIYYGMVVVYGFYDNKADFNFYTAPYLEEYNDVKSQLEGQQNCINMLLKILLGKGT